MQQQLNLRCLQTKIISWF